MEPSLQNINNLMFSTQVNDLIPTLINDLMLTLVNKFAVAALEAGK